MDAKDSQVNTVKEEISDRQMSNNTIECKHLDGVCQTFPLPTFTLLMAVVHPGYQRLR